MFDVTIIVQGQGVIFRSGPLLIGAATGDVLSAENVSGADFHTRLSGVAVLSCASEGKRIRLLSQIMPSEVRDAPEPMP